MSLIKMRRSIKKDRSRTGQAQTYAALISIMAAAMRGLDSLLIFVFGDPHWKSRTRIDWRKVIFFRKPLTRAERTGLLRRANQVLGADYRDDVEERVQREITKEGPSS